MARLQGIPSSVLETMLVAAAGNKSVVGKAIGDAMSINVLMRLLPRALYSAGLLGRLPDDVWKQAAAQGTVLLPNDLR